VCGHSSHRAHGATCHSYLGQPCSSEDLEDHRDKAPVLVRYAWHACYRQRCSVQQQPRAARAESVRSCPDALWLEQYRGIRRPLAIYPQQEPSFAYRHSIVVSCPLTCKCSTKSVCHASGGGCCAEPDVVHALQRSTMRMPHPQPWLLPHSPHPSRPARGAASPPFAAVKVCARRSRCCCTGVGGAGSSSRYHHQWARGLPLTAPGVP